MPRRWETPCASRGDSRRAREEAAARTTYPHHPTHTLRHSALYLYLAAERSRQQEQWAARQALQPQLDSLEEEFRAARVLFYSLLDEQQRRLYAGLESFRRGHGGDRQLAEALGLDEQTVARGRRELLAGQIERERIRRAGGGRPRAEKKRPRS